MGSLGANPMIGIFLIFLRTPGLFVLAASAQSPAAVIEELAGTPPGIQFMDYVEPGQVIHLGPHDRMVLGYLKSCWRETITGGTVTVGPDKSEVAGGEVRRSKVACEAGKMLLSTELAGKSGAMVFRQVPSRQAAAVPHPEFTLYGLSPVFEVTPGGSLVIERLDQPGERHEIVIAGQELIHGTFLDLAKTGLTLAPGGVYRAKLGAQEIVFKIDPNAEPGETPLVGRLARLQPRH
jgi:hypothetical protein